MPAPPVGLDITSTALIAVVLKKRGKGYSLVRHAVAALDHGIVVDGEVADVARLSFAIRALWEREGIKEKQVNLGVANQRCVVRTLDMPKMKPREIRSNISFEVSDNLPIPIENAVFDYRTVDSYKHHETGVMHQRHVVVMAYRESMERFRDAVTGAGLKLNRIDLAGFALMRAGLRSVRDQPQLQAQPPGEDGAPQVPAVAMVDIGPTSSNIVVCRDGICELNRVIGLGSNIFSQTLSEQFGWGQEDADRVRIEAGVLPIGGVEPPDDPYTDSRRVMQYVADQFAGELRTSFDYYSHSTGGRIASLVISGEGALLRGIEERFANELSVPVSILDASPHLDSGSIDELGLNHAQYGTALGLAMEDAA